jgi:hypothetical protein
MTINWGGSPLKVISLFGELVALIVFNFLIVRETLRVRRERKRIEAETARMRKEK